MQIAIINGPNLNLLGIREPEIYGTVTFEVYLETLRHTFPQIAFSYFQSNVEGELVTELQRVGFSADGIVLNAAAYTHTSIAIGDAIATINTKVVEVHISNIFARETFRSSSLISAKSVGVISGLGFKGYALAVQYFVNGNL